METATATFCCPLLHSPWLSDIVSATTVILQVHQDKYGNTHAEPSDTGRLTQAKLRTCSVDTSLDYSLIPCILQWFTRQRQSGATEADNPIFIRFLTRMFIRMFMRMKYGFWSITSFPSLCRSLLRSILLDYKMCKVHLLFRFDFVFDDPFVDPNEWLIWFPHSLESSTGTPTGRSWTSTRNSFVYFLIINRLFSRPINLFCSFD